MPSRSRKPTPPPPGLDTYRQKRSPDRTPEPFGGQARPAGGPLRFVVHQHAARNLHYDLRLELDGTFKSWAVPKGPSSHVEEKRLAVHVEDHPLEYGSFEGVIPAGNYGAGSVIIWDHGWYRSFKPEDLLAQYQSGKLELELFGFKLRGRWTLVRMGGSARKGNEWLLLKKVGAGVSEQELIERYPHSVVTGLTVHEMADMAGHVAAVREHVEGIGAPKATVKPKEQSPMLANLEEKPFDREGWIFEIKYDGVRVIAGRKGSDVELIGRSGQNVASRYPEIAEALRALPYEDFVVDGEIVSPDESGQPSFQHLQARMQLVNPHDIARARVQVPVAMIGFDCLALFGHDLRRRTLLERKECLRRILPPLGTVRYGDHVATRGAAFFAAADAMHLEGIVAKRAASSYVGKRTSDWIKIKCQRRQEFVIGGWSDPQGARGGFGALLVGLYEPGPDGKPRLIYVTNVGTGFDQKTLKSIREKLDAIARDTSPFAVRSPKDAGNHWVEPKLVCEVRFTEWTHDGGLRHPAFLGLRDDKKPEECVRETPVTLATAEPDPAEDGTSPKSAGARNKRSKGTKASGAKTAAPPAVPRPTVALTNLKKIFWPADGYTKGDLIAYYDAIAPWILPYLEDRPIFLTRYPDGIEGKSFYQKDAPVFVPEWVRTEVIYSGDGERENRFFVVNDTETLRYIANLGTIPIHMWSSRIGTLEQPDWMILDLDPKGAPFANVVRMAKVLKEILDELDLPGFPKTSGASGLHILVPLGARYTYEQSRAFARLLAMLAVQEEPEISTIVRAVQARGGKVYVDWGQNGHGQSIVSPYCVRPLPGAPVSCPLEWKEVNAKLDPAKWTIKTVPPRFEKMKDPLLGVFGEGIEMSGAIGKMEGMLKSR